MTKYIKVFLQVFLMIVLIAPVFTIYSPVHAQSLVDWQDSSTGLSANQSNGYRTSGLGFMAEAAGWPVFSMQGGVKDSGVGTLQGPTGIELGAIKIPSADSASLGNQVLDWAHNEITFSYGSGSQLKLWMSRLTPAALINSSSNLLDLFTGNVARATFNGSSVSNLPDGPTFPKYIAYMSGGSVKITSLSTSSTALAMDQNWILVWYGSNSQYVETKKPLSYTGLEWATATLPHKEAYQADVPILLTFQTLPSSVKRLSGGGLELSFNSASGYVSLLPISGRDHPRASVTEGWSAGLPAAIQQKAQWWAGHLCNYPLTASESYSFSDQEDTASISESFTYLPVCTGGTTFAPVPPMLGIAMAGLNINFSAPIINADLNTEFGPVYGVENTQSYTWTYNGLKSFVDAKRISLDSGQAPAELEQELEAQVNKVTSSGHYAPWIYSDHIPTSDFLGDIYWLNPADELYHLVEIAEVLPESVKGQLTNYIRAELSAYPPQDIYNLPLNQGTVRQGFSVSSPEAISGWPVQRPDVFLKRVPLFNLYAISRAYDLLGDSLPADLFNKAQGILNNAMSEQDWATFYWFKGFEDRPEAVINANRHFAGMIGFTRLAKKANDLSSAHLGYALLAKAAILRIGLAKYPRYLYSSGLVELPAQSDWQVRMTGGKWVGYIFNYQWASGFQDARQVNGINQFGVELLDHSGDPEIYHSLINSHLTAFRDMVPEMGRLLNEDAKADADIYINRTTSNTPHWYASFAEATLGLEHNLNHPMDAFQLFLAKAWIDMDTQDHLAKFADIPWLQQGDLFYMQKLAESIRAYRGSAWDDIILLSAQLDHQDIHLSWKAYKTVPGMTWKIEYQGEPGDVPSPIILSGTDREYTLTGMKMYTLYTIRITAMDGDIPLISSKPRLVFVTDIFNFLPNISKGY